MSGSESLQQLPRRPQCPWSGSSCLRRNRLAEAQHLRVRASVQSTSRPLEFLQPTWLSRPSPPDPSIDPASPLRNLVEWPVVLAHLGHRRIADIYETQKRGALREAEMGQHFR